MSQTCMFEKKKKKTNTVEKKVQEAITFTVRFICMWWNEPMRCNTLGRGRTRGKRDFQNNTESDLTQKKDKDGTPKTGLFSLYSSII